MGRTRAATDVLLLGHGVPFLSRCFLTARPMWVLLGRLLLPLRSARLCLSRLILIFSPIVPVLAGAPTLNFSACAGRQCVFDKSFSLSADPPLAAGCAEGSAEVVDSARQGASDGGTSSS